MGWETATATLSARIAIATTAVAGHRQIAETSARANQVASTAVYHCKMVGPDDSSGTQANRPEIEAKCQFGFSAGNNAARAGDRWISSNTSNIR